MDGLRIQSKLSPFRPKSQGYDLPCWLHEDPSLSSSDSEASDEPDKSDSRLLVSENKVYEVNTV